MDEVGPSEAEGAQEREAEADPFERKDGDDEPERREPDQAGQDEERGQERERQEDEQPATSGCTMRTGRPEASATAPRYER